MKIIALDLSLAHTGWAAFKDGLENWGVIDSPRGDGEYADLERLHSIVKQVADLARGSDLVAVEGFSFGSVMQSHVIGALGYMVRLWLWKSNIPFVLCAPKSLKKWACGKGSAKKDLMLREVHSRWGVSIDDDNAADAYALLKLAESLVGLTPETGLAKFQSEVVALISKKQGQRYEHLRPNPTNCSIILAMGADDHGSTGGHLGGNGRDAPA